MIKTSGGLLVSELEYLVLSLVAEARVASGYRIRCRLQKLKGTRWSAESGSVYRVLRRLTELGLINELGRSGVPNRERVEYGITDHGLTVMRAWLVAPFDDAEVEMLVDAMRLRALFLRFLNKQQRINSVRMWAAQNDSFVKQLEESSAKLEPHSCDYWWNHALLITAEARQVWLKKLLTEVRNDRLLVD
jgi:DNA-binding PadR family transcriptional regulator